jgi:two-component system phosphate regulon sensor histidine kinase PhoR
MRLKVNINFKIAITFIFIIGLILTGLFVFLNNIFTDHTFNRIRSNLTKELYLTRSFMSRYKDLPLKIDSMDRIADYIGGDLNVRVTIIDISGNVVGDSELSADQIERVENHLYRPEIQDAMSARLGESVRFSTTIKDKLLYVASVFELTNPRGFIRLSVPLSEINVVTQNLKQALFTALFFAFLCAVVISFIASFFVSRPIKEMAWLAQGIARGDYSKKIMVTSEDEIGELAGAFNYMSEQIKARVSEITSNKLMLEAVLLSMFDGVMVIDAGGNIILINETLKKLFAIKEEPTGRRPLEVIRNIEIQEIADVVLKIKKGVKKSEISLLIPGEKTLMVHATPVIRDGKTEGAVLVFHDITELRRLEKIRRDFIANDSHELRTPAASIKGYAETLLEGAINDKENAGDFIQIIYNDSERLAKLVDDLLDLSKIESGAMRLEMGPVNIRQITTRVLRGLKKQAEKKGMDISVDVPDQIPDARGDETRISQVILNLVDNAIKYNREKGKVLITAKELKDDIEVSVEDTGMGIPEEDIPRIFERFYRVDKARSRELGGTGLGLSIVKHIVQAHSGSVRLETELGRGSRFIFTLPKFS